MFTQADRPISPNAVFQAKDSRLIVIPRNRELSDDVAFRFPHQPISAEQYAAFIAKIDGEAVLLAMITSTSESTSGKIKVFSNSGGGFRKPCQA